MNDLTDVPQVGNGLFRLHLFFLVFILNINGVGAAVDALHLNIPATLMHDHTCAAADGAFLRDVVNPILEKNKDELGMTAEINV